MTVQTMQQQYIITYDILILGYLTHTKIEIDFLVFNNTQLTIYCFNYTCENVFNNYALLTYYFLKSITSFYYNQLI